MPSAGFEPATPATKQPQTYALDRAATEVGIVSTEQLKDKAVPLRAVKTLGRERKYYSSFLNSSRDEGKWSASRPGRALPPRKGPPVPFVQEAGWAPELVWTQSLEEKSFRLCWGSNLDRPVVQPVARQCTD
jgi:hypothetical protein